MPAYDWAVVYVPPQETGEVLRDVQLIDIFYDVASRKEALDRFYIALEKRHYDSYSSDGKSGAFLARIKWGTLDQKGVMNGIKIVEIQAILRGGET